MGLLYVFPVSLDEKDFVEATDQKITLKTYGLPYLFWGYAFAILIMVFFMFLAIKAPVLKLIQLGDETDSMLGYALLSFLCLIPIFLFAFFFFEKRIIKTKEFVRLEYRIYGFKFFTETFNPAQQTPFSVAPFLSSPNLARINGDQEALGFQNKGYFVLWLLTAEGKKINIDRHSRKGDLLKLEELLKLI